MKQQEYKSELSRLLAEERQRVEEQGEMTAPFVPFRASLHPLCDSCGRSSYRFRSLLVKFVTPFASPFAHLA